MFGYEIMRNGWAILTLLVSTATVLLTALFFIDRQKPRKLSEEGHEEYASRYLSVWQGIPTFLKVVISIIVIYAISYSILAIINPNSW